MGAILLVSDRENWAASFEKLLKEELQAEVRTASSNGMARECMNTTEYALVLILTPFAGDNGLYLARQALETSAGVLIACSPSYSLQYDSSVTDLCIQHGDGTEISDGCGAANDGAACQVIPCAETGGTAVSGQDSGAAGGRPCQMSADSVSADDREGSTPVD